jgi:hypothetical protein
MGTFLGITPNIATATLNSLALAEEPRHPSI